MSRFMREDAQFIIKKAIQAVLPDEAVRRALQEHAFSGKIVLVAAGKAAWQMAQAAHQCLGNLIDTGAVVTKYGHVKGPIANFACYEGGHPVPDENSFQGTQAALDLVSGLTEQDTVLFLLSGGGSALFEKPLVSGEELQDVTNQLLASGADIVEMNTIRKRLSAVKGGRFAQLCAPARVFSVVLSDILGDPLDMIASGPACPDPSTCAQARAIAEKYGLKLSEGVRRLLDQETPKELDNVESLVVGSVRELCTAAANACLELDYTPIMLTDRLCCQAREAGSFLASIARSHAEGGKSLAFLAGGETVVRLTGHGKGGRNQELALAAADGIDGLDNVLIFSVGSDGTDGPTDAAGGIVDGRTAQILADQGILIHQVLEDNNAYHALQKTDGLVITGPTGTNVNDVAVVLVRGKQSNEIDIFEEETAMLKIDLSKLSGFIPEDYVSAHLEQLEKAAAMIANHEGPGGDFTGWVHLPREYDKDEFARIQAAAEKIKKQSQVLVVIGIGGSYLGARAVIDLLKSPFYNQKPKDTPDIYFTGNGLSTDTLLELIEMIGERDFSVNVISKSGTTTESAIGFRVFKGILEERYGKEGARERIYATTDKARGALKGLADAEGYEEFVVPDAIGGRYSVLTAVGLLPIACAGVDIQALMDGAGRAMNDLSAGGPENPAWKYAAARHALFESGKKVEFLAGYEPPFRFFAEWWKQLYGESEGKEHKGLLPASLEYTADLHSMGQYIQEGQRTMSEVVVKFVPKGEFLIPHDPENIDGLNFLAGKPLSYVADRAMRGVILAHVDGGVPNVLIEMPPISETTVGYLIYFFEYVCGLSGHLLKINPFNQPGVEAYKSNMFALLGKPGYEEKQAELEKRL